MSARKKKGPAHAECPATRTTVRAKVTTDEHDAIHRFAKYRCGTTIEDLLRQALDTFLRSSGGKGLAELAAEERNRGRLVQGDLFDPQEAVT